MFSYIPTHFFIFIFESLISNIETYMSSYLHKLTCAFSDTFISSVY